MRSDIFSLLLVLAATPLFAQSKGPEPAPGLIVSQSSLPFAFDHFQGRPELVPVHHSTVEINNHKGANIAGSLAGSFLYKPKMTVEVAGSHARTVLHDTSPSFYVHTMEDPDGGGEGASGPAIVFAIVHAMPDKDRRIFAQMRFTQLSGNAKRNEGLVETATEQLPHGWLKLTPVAPLPVGEYALTPIPKTQNAYATVVYDFAIDPAAPEAHDAVQPSHHADDIQ